LCRTGSYVHHIRWRSWWLLSRLIFQFWGKCIHHLRYTSKNSEIVPRRCISLFRYDPHNKEQSLPWAALVSRSNRKPTHFVQDKNIIHKILFIWIQASFDWVKTGKIHPRTVHEDPESE
jgi:hypothetical protein